MCQVLSYLQDAETETMASISQFGTQATPCPIECFFFTFPWQSQALLRILWKFWIISPEKMHICIWFYEFTDVEEPIMDALESIGSRLRTLDWEMWVSLLSWKAASVSLLREVPNPSHLSCSLTKWLAPPQPHPAPAAHDEHLPAHRPDTSKAPPLQQSPCYPQVELAIPALGPIVPRILPSWPLKHLMLVS